MADIAETLLRFKLAQLEGKLAIYEALVGEISQLEHVEKVALNVKTQLEDVVKVWHACGLGKNHAH